MATHRPKVPKATPPAVSGKPAQETDGEVIRADFGGKAGRAPSAGTAAGEKPRSSGSARAGGPASAETKRPAGTKRPAVTNPAQAAGSGASAAARKTSYRTKASGAAAAADAEHPTPVPARAFSGRMLALAVVMIAITIMLAPTVKIFFEKRAEISALQDEIAAKKAEQDGLKKQVSRWQDPSYVKQQARDRINMVMPGETGYWVFGGDIPAGTPETPAGTGASGNPANLPWVDALWESIRRSATD